jgi:hypothetical protein
MNKHVDDPAPPAPVVDAAEPGRLPKPHTEADDIATPDAEPLTHGEASGGAMTGETGVLSSEDEAEGFVSGERREIENPRHPGVTGQLRHPAAEGTDEMTPGGPGSLAGPGYPRESTLPAHEDAT